jgi:hypothetical protein
MDRLRFLDDGPEVGRRREPGRDVLMPEEEHVIGLLDPAFAGEPPADGRGEAP